MLFIILYSKPVYLDTTVVNIQQIAEDIQLNNSNITSLVSKASLTNKI